MQWALRNLNAGFMQANAKNYIQPACRRTFIFEGNISLVTIEGLTNVYPDPIPATITQLQVKGL
jgi:hypothetical protein